ncbi:hypothetical protein B0J11DRAFT_430927 [Dendryphion nanum]|uniref:Uncharacterized protein n=1 Tax=Dendryphion nanum TaxID=256645 RepID=A0A9P9E1T1_9PLEO|nr:hypothetical protein B0J11DRAFT_430927 [Dendryphion nanum]
MLDEPPLTPARPRPTSNHSTLPTPAQTQVPRDAAFSLLLSLPRELRNKVYAYALTSQFPFWYPNPNPTIEHDIALGLLTTSRQIYEESAPVLYTLNRFLFTHPSDCNIFRVVASPKFSGLINSVYFRIREKDLRLWTKYLGSTAVDRSLKADLPKLKSLWIFLRCGTMAALTPPAQQAAQAIFGLPPGLAAQVHAVHAALGQQVQALQHQIQTMTQAVVQGNAPADQQGPAAGSNDGNQQPAPPAPAMPFHQFAAGFQAPNQPPHLHHLHHHHPPPGQPHGHVHVHHHANQPGPFYTSFLRWERELGVENLCLSLQETRPKEADVKIVCIMRLPKPEVVRLSRVYANELSVDRNGDARTRFRKLHGAEVSLEISGYDITAS